MKKRIIISIIILIVDIIATFWLSSKWILPTALNQNSLLMKIAAILVSMTLISIFVLSISSVIHKLRDDGITAGTFCGFAIFGPLFAIIIGLLFSYDKETKMIVIDNFIIPAICGYVIGYLFGTLRGIYCEFFIKDD